MWILGLKGLMTAVTISLGLRPFSLMFTILGDPGQIVGARGSLNGWKNMVRRKVKNGKKSPWGQCLTRPVPNGRRSSAF